jgi:cytosine/adenosine deaminase-related metal-dependent hydrolase
VTALFRNAHVVTMDDGGAEHSGGWILVGDGLVQDVGSGERPDADETHDLNGAVVTPGLINTHHHLWQNLTRARAQDENLFGWLQTLYPVWAAIDEEAEYAAARCGLAELALAGCTTVFDHHYLFPPGRQGLLEAEIRAARELGVRIVASRGSMDLGESDGGLPPDAIVEERDDVLAATEAAARLADGGQVQIAAAPCSPFSVTKELMRESAELARQLGLQLHTHLAETVEEEEFAQEQFGCTPVEYLEELGWLAEDVWCAHCVHLSQEDVAKFAKRDVGVAHCPSSNMRLGAGMAPGPPRTSGATSSSRSSRRCSSRGRAAGRRRSRPAMRCGSARAAARRCSGETTSGNWHPASAPTSPSGARTVSSSAAPRIRLRASSSPGRTGSIASTSAAKRSCAAGT